MFDPYHRWLGIPKTARPPTHYQLLGLVVGETDPDVIEEAAIRQTTHVRAYQIGAHAAECTKMLNEIAVAKATLLNPAKKQAYDESLSRVQTSRAVGITAQPPPRQASPLAELEADDGSMISAPQIRKPARRGDNTAVWLIGAGAAGVLLIAAVVIGLVLANRSPQVDVVAAPQMKGKEPPPKGDAEPKVDPKVAESKPVQKKPEAPMVQPEPEPANKVGVVKPVAPRPDNPPRAMKGVSVVLEAKTCPSLAFTSDRAFAAAATTPACILDAKTRQVIDQIQDRANSLTAVKKVMFTRDGTKLLIACGNYGAATAVYDRAAKTTQTLKRKDGALGDYLLSAALSARGRYAASTHAKGVYVYDVAKADTLHVLTPGVRQLDCRFLEDEKTLLTAGEDGILRLWDVQAGVEKKRHDFTKLNIAERAGITCFEMTPDERWLLYGYSKYFRRFDLVAEKPHSHTNVERDQVVAVAVSPDGQFFADMDKDGRFTIASDQADWPYRGEAKLSRAQSLAFGPDDTLWIAGDGGIIAVTGWAAKLRGANP